MDVKNFKKDSSDGCAEDMQAVLIVIRQKYEELSFDIVPNVIFYVHKSLFDLKGMENTLEIKGIMEEANECGCRVVAEYNSKSEELNLTYIKNTTFKKAFVGNFYIDKIGDGENLEEIEREEFFKRLKGKGETIENITFTWLKSGIVPTNINERTF